MHSINQTKDAVDLQNHVQNANKIIKDSLDQTRNLEDILLENKELLED